MAVSAQWNTAGIAADVRAGADEGLFEAAEVLLAQANDLVPIEEGVLQNSGTAEIADGTARVGYNTPYARVQHEDLTLNHPNGREAKFLEKPLNRFGPELEQIVAAAIERRLQ
ncbi:minor capsid protein [Nocardia testacea]|uniref:minor capsid protein n=1 Tax=Nocardia testacea TaxID=248551 RepID=UPI003A86B424